jgi:hypothetical protein
MESSNAKIKDYLLMPTADLPPNSENRMRISSRSFGEFAYDELDEVLKALTDRLNDRGITKMPKHAAN